MLNGRGVVIGLLLISMSAIGAQPSLDERLELVSAYFVGQPYELGALGEGVNGKYNKNPLYRFDAFDCVTYVETVLALALSSNFSEFTKKINTIRYKNGVVDFTHRNHFTSIDWNVNNNGIVHDITRTIVNDQDKAFAVEATAIIDKPSWYRHFSSQDIKTSGSPKQKEDLAMQLRDAAHQVNIETSVIHYLPFTTLLDKNGKMPERIQKQIPDGSIIEIVRPNWDLTKEIGTHLHISHLGFAFRTHQGLVFRNASSTLHKVADVPLDQYLQEASKNPTIKGIMVLKVG